MRWRVVVAVLLLAAPAAAQGNGHPQSSSGSGVRNFGSWLDDASVLDSGTGFVSVGLSVWKMPAYREVDLPSIDSGFAIGRRAQVGMTVPYYLANQPGGPVSSGFGDVYMDAKVQLRAPSAKRTGFALIPMVEVLSVAPSPDASRVQWALPVSLERQGSGWRVMGSGGYFSRGAAFGAAALEIELSKRAWATGSLSHSYSTHHDDVSAALGLSKIHTDVSGGLTFAIRSDLSVYGSLGRTISAHDSNSASMMASAGVSFGLKRPVR